MATTQSLQHVGPEAQTEASSAGLGAIWREIVAFWRSVNTAIDAAHAYESLSSLSDERLAEMGLDRASLPQHVSRTYLHI